MNPKEFTKNQKVRVIYGFDGMHIKDDDVYELMQKYADLQLLQPDVSGMLCGSFDPDNKTSSATKCKCGREKWEHPKAT